jgi:pimeloyl-ACP methyl ester carboxylesterase
MRMITLALPALLAGWLPGIGASRDPAPRREVRWGYAPAESLALVHLGERPSTTRPLMLLVPGPVGSAFSMRRIADLLEQRGHAVLIADPLGMGASTRPEGADYALSRQAERLRRLLDDAAPRGTPVLVAALGTSATIALHLAAIDTTRIRGVVSIAGGPVDRQGTRTLRLAMRLAPLLDNRLGKSIARKRFEAGARAQSQDDSWLTPEVLKAYVEPLERDIRGLFRTLG